MEKDLMTTVPGDKRRSESNRFPEYKGKFSSPEQVANEESLSREEKLNILKRWEYDARELSVASDEGMTGATGSNMLGEIHAALARLGATTDPESQPTTRQGGITLQEEEG